MTPDAGWKLGMYEMVEENPNMVRVGGKRLPNQEIRLLRDHFDWLTIPMSMKLQRRTVMGKMSHLVRR